MAIIGKCEGCKKLKLFVKNRHINLPIGGKALSKKKFCRKCVNLIQKAIKLNG